MYFFPVGGTLLEQTKLFAALAELQLIGILLVDLDNLKRQKAQ
jgi:hypothetical protein